MAWQRQIWNYPRAGVSGTQRRIFPNTSREWATPSDNNRQLNMKTGGPTPGAYTEGGAVGVYDTQGNVGDWCFHFSGASNEVLPENHILFAQVRLSGSGGGSTPSVLVMADTWGENPNNLAAQAGKIKCGFVQWQHNIPGIHQLWFITYTSDTGVTFYWDQANGVWQPPPLLIAFGTRAGPDGGAAPGFLYNFFIERRNGFYILSGGCLTNSGSDILNFFRTTPVPFSGINRTNRLGKLMLGDNITDRGTMALTVSHLSCDYGKWRNR